MSSRTLVARFKPLLFVILATSAASAVGSADQSGSADAELPTTSDEVAAISATDAPAPVTGELPMPALEAPTPEVVTPLPADPAAAPDAAGLEPSVEIAPPPAEPPPAPAAPPAPVPPLVPADSMVPLERAAMKPILVQAAAESGLPSDLVMAQAWAESSWQDSVVSTADAVGVLQITPPTVDFISHQLLGLDHPLDALDPADNARMGTRYMLYLLDQTDDNLHQALIAYNQGLGALRRNGPYAEALRYADRVLALRPLFVTG